MIAISISTTTNRLFNIKKEQFPQQEGIIYFISIQGLDIDKNKVGLFIKNNLPYFRVLYTESKGLSNNRNNSLKELYKINTVEYIYIADDDIYVNIKGIFQLVEKMKLNDISLGCGKISCDIGEFKKYPLKEGYFNIFNMAKISSVEMLLNKSFLASNKIFFDTKFGLGGIFDSGEEYIFCSDILKLKGTIKYYPIVLCQHPPISSGKNFYLTPEKIAAKGAMFYRIFGNMGLLFSLAFRLKKHRIYKKKLGFFQFYRYMVSGQKHLKKLLTK